MNIYHIEWTQSESYALNAVVIAKNEEEALKELDLNSEYETEEKVTLIGICTDGTNKSTVCRESL